MQKNLETELENALVQQITKLLLEFRSGFAFMGRQYSIQVGKREFFIDLLFYNVKLRCYFVVELKQWNLSQSLLENYLFIYQQSME